MPSTYLVQHRASRSLNVFGQVAFQMIGIEVVDVGDALGLRFKRFAAPFLVDPESAVSLTGEAAKIVLWNVVIAHAGIPRGTVSIVRRSWPRVNDAQRSTAQCPLSP